MKGMCKICGKERAEVRDRDDPTNPRKTVCRRCHGEKLKGDMKAIHKQWQEEEKGGEDD